jgi:hypothetical protein
MQRWQKQADGNLLRTIGNFRMVVHSKPISGAIRFILIREAVNCPGFAGAMLASGYEQSVGCAMAAVEKMAARLMATISSVGSQMNGRAGVEAAA